MNFPKAEAVTEMGALAEQLRAAAAELDEIARWAPLLELGSLRRQAYAVRIQVVQAIDGELPGGAP